MSVSFLLFTIARDWSCSLSLVTSPGTFADRHLIAGFANTQHYPMPGSEETEFSQTTARVPMSLPSVYRIVPGLALLLLIIGHTHECPAFLHYQIYVKGGFKWMQDRPMMTGPNHASCDTLTITMLPSTCLPDSTSQSYRADV